MSNPRDVDLDEFADFVKAVAATHPHLLAGDDMTPIEPTQEMVDAFQTAWLTTPEGAPGDRTRAGLRAALKVLQEGDQETS